MYAIRASHILFFRAVLSVDDGAAFGSLVAGAFSEGFNRAVLEEVLRVLEMLG